VNESQKLPATEERPRAVSSDSDQIELLEDDGDLDNNLKSEKSVHKWNELFKETMSPTALKLGVKAIKNSRLHGA